MIQTKYTFISVGLKNLFIFAFAFIATYNVMKKASRVWKLSV